MMAYRVVGIEHCSIKIRIYACFEGWGHRGGKAKSAKEKN